MKTKKSTKSCQLITNHKKSTFIFKTPKENFTISAKDTNYINQVATLKNNYKSFSSIVNIFQFYQ